MGRDSASATAPDDSVTLDQIEEGYKEVGFPLTVRSWKELTCVIRFKTLFVILFKMSLIRSICKTCGMYDKVHLVLIHGFGSFVESKC